ncbi:MAG TPA: metal-dependent hydrolase [Gaiellaceae bacterium]|nr:metal-dependent hydrolase [Gaiellaceae bacterium]
MADVQLTWLGHAAFRFDTPGGKRVYIDPYLDNPKCPENEKRPERMDILALTHGHGDHIGNSVDLVKEFKPTVVGIVEILSWLGDQGADVGEVPGMNKGGTRTVDGVKFTMTDAKHSGGGPNGEYLGDPAGYVVEVENGTKLYFAGDTGVFGDMQLIRRLYEPDVAILPIGDHFTMGPKDAAVALELLGVSRCVPCHYGTFPLLTGTPDELAQRTDVELLVMQPGDTITV